MSLAILVPVLARPWRVKPLLDAVELSTPQARVIFICDPGDDEEQQTIADEREARDLRVELFDCGGPLNYAEKINWAVQSGDEELLLLGADDIEPLPDWFDEALRFMAEGIGVVGLNDLIPRTRNHATHFLIARWYAELPTIDGGEGPLHTGYRHWYCDDELIATARKRNAYVYAVKSRVRHIHPMVGGRDDETYALGRSMRRQDRRQFHRRVPLWT